MDIHASVAAKLDYRPIILAAAAWGSTWIASDRVPATAFIVAGIGLLILLLSWGRQRWLLAAAGAIILVMASCTGLRNWVQDLSPINGWAAENAVVKIVAVTGGGKLGEATYGQWWQTTAWVHQAQARGEKWETNVPVRLVVGGELVSDWVAVRPGTTVQTRVMLTKTLEPESNVAVARAREPPEILAEPSFVDALVERFREGLRDAASGLSPAPRALVPALVLGDTSAMTPVQREQFIATGLTHLVAVSGTHLSILLGFAAYGLGSIGIRGWWRRALMLVVVLFFVLLCRAGPSLLRAAAMGTVGLVGLGYSQKSQALRYLAWTIIGLLFIDPWLCRSVGFALSVAATAGIVLWAEPWSQRLKRFLPGWLAVVVCVPLAAQLATQPLITAISHQVSLVGVIANMISVPLVAPAMALGFAALVTAAISPLIAEVLATMAGWFAQGLCWIGEYGSSLPGATLGWSVDPFAIALVACISLGIALVIPALLSYRLLAGACALALVFSLLHPFPIPGWPPQQWAMVSCAVGQGDATVFNAGDGHALLIDAGPEPKALDSCLRQLGIRHVVAVLTHLHADHIGGLPALRNSRKLNTLIAAEVNQIESAWKQQVELGSVRFITAASGMHLVFGQVSLQVIALKPSPAYSLGALGEPGDDDAAVENDSSLVLRVETAGLSVIVGGDIEEAGQRNALVSNQLKADVLLVPHHGSARFIPRFFDAVNPALALISVGKNSYGHPSASVLNQLAGIPTYRTDQDGSIAVRKNGTDLEVTMSH
ncbi:MAG: ComEC/Rec2 family competence protein [Propionibacteriaceae bacterium]|nr:ComEC/Rec2 family competence protein [Propionibacteriaceae bacterium]